MTDREMLDIEELEWYDPICTLIKLPSHWGENCGSLEARRQIGGRCKNPEER